MLLRLFYWYHKSSKKSRKLVSVAEELKEVFANLPVRCQGTRWISHKQRALQWIVDCFGAYVTHSAALAADSSTKPAAGSKSEYECSLIWNSTQDKRKVLNHCKSITLNHSFPSTIFWNGLHSSNPAENTNPLIDFYRRVLFIDNQYSVWC